MSRKSFSTATPRFSLLAHTTTVKGNADLETCVDDYMVVLAAVTLTMLTGQILE